MFRSVSSEVRLFSILASLTFAALGLFSSPPAVAGHSTSTATSSGTSTCKLCTLVDWQIEVGDLDVIFENAPNWNGAIRYTSRLGQTITGTVCDDDGTNCDTAEFRIPDANPVRCTGYAATSCTKSGRRDSLRTFSQQCGTQTPEGPADCVGRLEAVTAGINNRIHIGDGVNLGGAAALTSTECATVFPNVKGKGGFSIRQMGEIVQLHVNNKTCSAPTSDIVDQRQDQRACSSPFGSTEAGSCKRDGVAVAAGITLNQSIIGAAAASCLPGTMQQVCSPTKDEGKHRILFTGAALAQQGVSPNDVITSSFKCGNQVPPIDVVRGDTDGDLLDDFDVRCFTCNLETGAFLCAGGQCELTGTDGVQPFAALCNVDLN